MPEWIGGRIKFLASAVFSETERSRVDPEYVSIVVLFSVTCILNTLHTFCFINIIKNYLTYAHIFIKKINII